MITDERFTAYINSLENGNPSYLDELEAYSKKTRGSHYQEGDPESDTYIVSDEQTEADPGSRNRHRFFCVIYEGVYAKRRAYYHNRKV